MGSYIAIYSSCDICNLDETVFFGKLCPIMVLGQRTHNAKVEKKQNRGLPLPFWLMQMERRKDVTVTWKSEKPRCFKGIGSQCNTLVSEKA